MKMRFAAVLLAAFFVAGCVNTSMVEYHKPQPGEKAAPAGKSFRIWKSTIPEFISSIVCRYGQVLSIIRMCGVTDCLKIR